MALMQDDVKLLLFTLLTTKALFDVKLKCNAKVMLGGKSRKIT